jgi:hypothetical protein
MEFQEWSATVAGLAKVVAVVPTATSCCLRLAAVLATVARAEDAEVAWQMANLRR